MSYTVQQLLSLAGKFEELADDSLTKTAAEKKNKDTKKKGKFPFWLMKKKPKASEKDTEDSKKDMKPSAKSKEVKKDKKKKSAYYDAILAKFGQQSNGQQSKEQIADFRGGDPDPNFPFGNVPDATITEFPVNPNQKLKSPVGWSGKTIDPVFQTMLGVSADGKLGDKTKAALAKYKQSLGAEQSGWSDELALEALKNEPEFKSKSPMKKNPATGLYIRYSDLGTHTDPYTQQAPQAPQDTMQGMQSSTMQNMQSGKPSPWASPKQRQ